MNHSNAAKILLFDEHNNILVLKRTTNATHNPGMWDIPGGRLNPGEGPAAGVVRETLEETGITIPEPTVPVGVHHFTRQDGQVITMIVYTLRVAHQLVTISSEHTDHLWAPVALVKEHAHHNYHGDIDRALIYLHHTTICTT